MDQWLVSKCRYHVAVLTRCWQGGSGNRQDSDRYRSRVSRGGYRCLYGFEPTRSLARRMLTTCAVRPAHIVSRRLRFCVEATGNWRLPRTANRPNRPRLFILNDLCIVRAMCGQIRRGGARGGIREPSASLRPLCLLLISRSHVGMSWPRQEHQVSPWRVARYRAYHPSG